jgi:tRNA (guanine37-N1)-methyltransferase
MNTFHIITLFPESLGSYLNASIVKRAQEKGLVSIKYYNPRDFALSDKPTSISSDDKSLSYSDRRVDNRPYGGGPGMVIEALPVIRAIEYAVGKKLKTIKGKKAVKIVFFNPAGKQFTNEIAEDYKKYTDIVMVCGRYEGIDARIKKVFPMVDITVGPYVLTGGELPAMIMVDAISRRIPGVLGDSLSLEESRVASSDVYTRPPILEYKGKKYKVPKVLIGGNHALIEEWKKGRNK